MYNQQEKTVTNSTLIGLQKKQKLKWKNTCFRKFTSKGKRICKLASNFSYLGHSIFNLTLRENALDCFEFLEFFSIWQVSWATILKSDSFSIYLLQFPTLPFISRDVLAVFTLCQRAEAKVEFQFITQMFPNSIEPYLELYI